ncbi:MAG TPA: hypothetical protein VJJ26_01860, partial [Candidatus Babeliales bacterium]|nr:hypothetical protein [Candidatus Babeliales bacterium]
MKKFRVANCYTNFLAISCLLLPFYLQSIDRERAYISKAELHEVLDNVGVHYVYLGKEFSRLYDVMSRINELEDNQASPIYELKKHIEDGFSIGLYDAVVEALDYAERTLAINASKISPEENEAMAQDLDLVIHQVINETLTINTKKLSPGSIYLDT